MLTIASNIGANKELIRDAETGMIYTFGNAKELAATLHNIDKNRRKYSKIAATGSRVVREKFSTDNNVNI